MKMENKITVGQSIFYISTDGRHVSKELEEVKITKVGKKYFETEKHYLGRFFIDTLMHDGGQYSSRYKVYLTRQDYEDEKETQKILRELRDYFGHYGNPKISLDNLRTILSIVKPL